MYKNTHNCKGIQFGDYIKVTEQILKITVFHNFSWVRRKGEKGKNIQKIMKIRVPKCIKQTLTKIKGEIDSKTVILGDFNTLFTSMDRSSRQKINKARIALNNTLDQWTSWMCMEHSIQKHQNTHFFRCTWNIPQDRSHSRMQNKAR